MQARMKHPAMVVPDAMPALQALGKAIQTAARKGRLSEKTLHLAYLRASQINGCSVCVMMHGGDAKRAGETDDRLLAVGAWREAPYFDDAERAALDLTEAMTRLSDRPEAVSDQIWAEAARHYDEPALATLVTAIGTINFWNRLNCATKQPGGAWTAQYV